MRARSTPRNELTYAALMEVSITRSLQFAMILISLSLFVLNCGLSFFVCTLHASCNRILVFKSASVILRSKLHLLVFLVSMHKVVFAADRGGGSWQGCCGHRRCRGGAIDAGGRRLATHSSTHVLGRSQTHVRRLAAYSSAYDFKS